MRRWLKLLHADCQVTWMLPIRLRLYLLNAAALSKLQAVENLAVDLSSYNIDVAVITETHFKVKHSDSAVAIDGYTIFRRDRQGRRAGGVALYVRSNIQSSVWTYSADNRTYELHWVRVGMVLHSYYTFTHERYGFHQTKRMSLH